MQVKSSVFYTSDNFRLYVNTWLPDENQEIKGIVQLHHGLAEHTMRYDRFGSILAENGFIFNAYDMRGHGKTGATSVRKGTGMMGKIADKNGFERALQDLNEMIVYLRNRYKGVPVILLGHSFGSFIAQAYIERYGNNIKGCILSGTAGPRRLLISLAQVLLGGIRLVVNPNLNSPFMDKLCFGMYNNKIENPTSKFSWLSKNEFVVKMYEEDQWCGFPLTISFMYDMLHCFKYIHKPGNMKKIPVTLPILFVYGSDDPVGDYGKTIERLYRFYKKIGITSLQKKVYIGDRHEVLNEDDREVVEKDLLDWLSDLTNKQN